jgi:hypothetical protein
VSDYRIFIALEVIATLRTLRSADQRRITQVFDNLVGNPFRKGDYVDQDEIGRPIQVLIVGSCAVFYWADHPAKEIKVTDLKPAGR